MEIMSGLARHSALSMYVCMCSSCERGYLGVRPSLSHRGMGLGMEGCGDNGYGDLGFHKVRGGISISTDY